MRLIDADALIKDLEYDVELDARALDDTDLSLGINRELVQFDKDCKQNAVDMLKKAPTVDAVPVRHGKWVGAESQCGIGCPFCGTPVDEFCANIDYINLIYEPNYCPNCGAKMDAERKEECGHQ